MPKIDECYNQPTGVASAGTTTPAAKQSGDIKNDALGNPGRYSRNQTTVATEDPNSELDATRELQLGSNGYQSNGFDAHKLKDTSPASVRGFGDSVANKGGYQRK